MTKRQLKSILPVVLLLMAAMLALPARAQDFSVASFRELPNDVSAFINPVRDLNDEDCALLKIVGPADFVFSTPLGIVKREDKTGEIWIYVPRGSRKITLKHAEWGVLRDYAFPSKLESHKTYEMALRYPHTLPSEVLAGQPSIVTVRDTLVVTRVDTLVVDPIKPKIPLEFGISAGIGIGGRAPYAFPSLMLSMMKRHGGYLRLSALPGHKESPTATCDRYGAIDGQARFYSGATRKRLLLATAGPVHRLSDRWTIFEGIGYGETILDWELAPSEGGGYVRNSYFSSRGMAAEIGAQFKWRRVVFSLSASTLRGTQWFGTLSIGFRPVR